MSLDLLCHAGLLILALVLATPREERSSVVGMGRSLLGLAGFVLIAALFSTFVMVGFFDFLCTQFPASQWVDMWRYCATLADLRTLGAHGDELVVMWDVREGTTILVPAGHGDFLNYCNGCNPTPPWSFELLAPQFCTWEVTVSFMLACFITVSVFLALLLIRPAALVAGTLMYLLLLLVASLVFIFAPSLLWMFLAFECLLLTSLGLLKLTSKSERIGEAVSEMFMWTLFGSFFLLLGFFSLYAEFGTNMDALRSSVALGASATPGLIGLFFIVGFGVKVPIWPFTSWLLKAHVEASVEFSILLSGFIVKLGILGLWRVLDTFGVDWLYLIVFASSCLAILDATLRLFVQTDLKRIVALTTVIEMNWLNLCYFAGDESLVFLAHFLLIAHCFTTASEFLLVDLISKRYGTRDFWQIVGLWYAAPALWYLSFFVVLTTMGFPGTSIFLAKFIFLTVILSYSWWLFIFFLFIYFLVLPLFFIRLWVPVWFGLRGQPTIMAADLTTRELCLLAITTSAGLLLGVYPTFFFSLF